MKERKVVGENPLPKKGQIAILDCVCFVRVYVQVGEYMSTSCGGLVGLSVLATIIVTLGVLAATVTIRDGRVAPIEPDNMSFF